MKKIGIVTYHNSHNYGSVLQAYALARFMQKMDLDTKIIDFRHPKSIAMYESVWWSKERTIWSNFSNILRHILFKKDRERERLFNVFIDNKLPLTQRYNKKEEIEEDFDYLVCGSDQIWNPHAHGMNDSIYYLNFGKPNTIKFSYSASSGGEEFAKGCEKEIFLYLSDLKRIGVRERNMQEYIDKKFHLKSYLNPDPTALLEKDDWNELEEPINNPPTNYLLIYSLQNMHNTVLFAKEIGEKYNLPVIHINPNRNRKGNKTVKGVRSLNNVSPGQFLWLFHHASFIVTNTFHGNMFSIIYRKPFVCYAKESNDERICTLHHIIGMDASRRTMDINALDESFLKLDYTPIEGNIQKFKDEGIAYIKMCIE